MKAHSLFIQRPKAPLRAQQPVAGRSAPIAIDAEQMVTVGHELNPTSHAAEGAGAIHLMYAI
jgi:hypothetical protein